MPTIQLHPLFIMFAGIAILSGAFVELMTIVLIVCIHEAGHFIAARFYSWRIRRIYMWIFGAVMETDEHGIRPIHEECIVIIAGPLQHIWIYGVAWILQLYEILPPTIIEGIMFYNTVILIFNLLPIWPLDGGKLLYLLFTSKFPYQKGYEWTLIISQICCVGLGFVMLFVQGLNIQLWFMIGFLMIEIWREWKRKSYVYMRFLLHRLHGQAYVRGEQQIQVSPHIQIDKVLKKFKRERNHYIFVKHHQKNIQTSYNPIHEKTCLYYFFYKNGYDSTINDVYTSQFDPSRARLHIK